MMTLQVISPKKELIHEIADYLLSENLIAYAIISNDISLKKRSHNGTIESSNQYILKGISKSLLFSTINTNLRTKYGDHMPLLYSEPIILIDPKQTEFIIKNLAKV
jgi:hypothetical protein